MSRTLSLWSCSPFSRAFSFPTFHRTLFSFPSRSESQHYREQKVLPYRQAQLYSIVSDVASYPSFVPFCTASRVTKPLAETGSDIHVMEAELTVGFLSFKESYVSRVTCVPFTSVTAEASSTTPLFKTLKTSWTFQPVTPGAKSILNGRDYEGPTLVTLDLIYAFASPVHAAMSGAFFGQVSKQMVKAFEERCDQVYNPSN